MYFGVCVDNVVTSKHRLLRTAFEAADRNGGRVIAFDAEARLALAELNNELERGGAEDDEGPADN
jgi:hypothetical protein